MTKRSNRKYSEENNKDMSMEEKLNALLKKLDIKGYDQNDISKIINDIELLKKNNLELITHKLFSQTKTKKFFDIMVEHDFTADLLRGSIDRDIINKIIYEPSPSSIDLKIECANTTFWIQIKALSNSEKTNRQNIIINEIEKCCQDIKVGKYFDIKLSEDFSDSNIEDICAFIGEKAAESDKNSTFYYINSKTNDTAKISFLNSRGIKLDNLTLSSSGDIEFVDCTGLSNKQIKESFEKAASRFLWDSGDNVINLIMIEIMWAHDDRHISEALYGTEEVNLEFNAQGQYRNFGSRKNDGLFENESFSSKVSGIIVRMRKGYKLHEGYWKCLCINEKYIQHSELITSVINVDKLIRCSEYPGDNFFGLAENTDFIERNSE